MHSNQSLEQCAGKTTPGVPSGPPRDPSTTTRHLTVVSLTLVMIALCALITHTVMTSVLIGLLSGIFISAGFSDLRSGVIPNVSMSIAALAAFVLGICVNGLVSGALRLAFVALAWGLIATARYARSGIGGGDLKMIGVTWLVFAAFPPPLALLLMILWALIFSVILTALRIRKVRHVRAGLALATTAILTWVIGLGILA